MSRVPGLKFSWWQEEDLEELSKKYPGFFNKTMEELEQLRQELNYEAEVAYDRVQKLESDADTIEMYMNAVKEKGNNY